MAIITILTLLFAGIFGAIVGSFLNVFIYRLPRDSLSVSRPRRSFCPSCGTAVPAWDNIPIVSYILLRGRCRFCGTGISLRYPLVEALTGALFLLLAWQRAPGFIEGGAGWISHAAVYAVYLYLISVTVVVTFIDLEFQIIPDAITLSGMAAAPVFSFFLPGLHCGTAFLVPEAFGPRLTALVASIEGMLVGGGVLYLVGWLGSRILHREALGFGDVKYMAFMGGLLGWEGVLMVFFLGCAFGTLVGLPYRALTRRQEIPFGPFLSLGVVALLFFRSQIFHFILEIWPAWVGSLL